MKIRRVLPLFLFSMVFGSALAEETTPADPFACPADLQPNVDFWKRVWSEWRLDQVVFHDDRYPAVIYETMTLPGEIGDTYTEEQRAFVKSRREAWSALLRELERKVAANEPLDEPEQFAAERIASSAGAEAIVGAADRVRSQRGLRERFLRGLEISGRYHREFTRVLAEEGVPEDLAYLPHVESSFQVQARSSAGAVGVWQFTRGAARIFMKVGPAIDERLDPVAAARGAARYLKTSYDEFGSWPIAITSYNHGVDGMRAAVARFGDDFARIVDEYDGRTFGFASRNFYAEFLAAREIAKDPTQAFPEGVSYERPLSHDRFVTERATTVAGLSHVFGVPSKQLVELNPAWTRKAARGQAALPAGVEVWLPEGTLQRIAAASEKPAASTSPAPPESGNGDGVAVVHIVRRGESLFEIASRYGVRVSELIGLNGLRNADVIHAGQRLQIPAR